jgi:hypothetical protein
MKKVLFLILICFSFISSTYALECSAKEKVSLSANATKITASYEFKTDENGVNYFLITAYNIDESTFLSYTDESGKIQSLVNLDGVDPSFKDYNLDTTFKYQFDIYVNGSEGCISKVRSFTLVKPKKNPFYVSMDECKYEKMKDYYYCKEWISSDFKVDEDTIIKNIRAEFNKTTTMKSVDDSGEKNNLVTILDLYKQYRVYILIGLGLGIIIDIIYIYLSYKKIKDAEF